MAQFTAPAEVQKLIAMKPESAAGTDVFADTYVAADVIEADARSIRVTNDPNEIENLVLMGNLGRAPSLKGARLSRVDFRCPVRGLVGGSEYDDSPELVPPIDRPLRGCRLGRTFANPGASNSSVKYQPTNTEETMTIYVVQPIPGSANCLSRQFVGCLGTARLNGVAGEGMFAEFSFVGAFEEEKDITFVGGTLTLTPRYPQLVSAAFQIGTGNYAPRIRTVGFDMGNRVGRLPSINASSGVAGFKVVDRRPVLTVDPEVDLDANSGWWAAFRDGAPLKDCTYQLGSAHVNRLKFQFASDGSTGNLEVITHDLDSRDDLTCFRISLLPTISAGNDDWSLLFD
jgi:hypothetical protein